MTSALIFARQKLCIFFFYFSCNIEFSIISYCETIHSKREASKSKSIRMPNSFDRNDLSSACSIFFRIDIVRIVRIKYLFDETCKFHFQLFIFAFCRNLNSRTIFPDQVYENFLFY